MTAGVLEAVPNFSEGRDQGLLRTLVDAIGSAGAEVLDWSADADHHRAVVTCIGRPQAVEDGVVAAAGLAAEAIDLRRHRGVHPRIGALDVLPLVPLVGLTMAEARASARRVGARIAREVGVPVFYYGAASDPPGRTLAELRRGGFEALQERWPEGRHPDEAPVGARAGAHPTAGATCVGARPVLLAWNVVLAGVSLEQARVFARDLRERGGGFQGLRALAFRLESRGVVQVSMNLEDVTQTSPLAVFGRIEELARAAGGSVVETEVIGMIPDELLLTAAADRLALRQAEPGRVLARRVLRHVVQQEQDVFPERQGE